MSGRSGRPALDAPTIAGDEHPPRCFLLFAGSLPAPRGGLGDLVGAFQSEAAAHEAFRHLRVSQTSASSWAQLAVVDGNRGIRAVSWFGIGATPARAPVARTATCHVPSAAGLDVGPTPRRHLARRVVVCLVSLVALASITLGAVSDDGTLRPATPEPASVGGGGPANSPVVPFSVDGSAVVAGTGGTDS